MKLIDGGREHFREGDQVLVGGRRARGVCGSFKTYVYRGMVSVQYADGELDLLEGGQVERMEAG